MDVDLKEEAKRLIDAMPRLSSWDDLMHEIYVRQTIEVGLAQSEQNLGTPVQEIRARYGLPE
jgi:hypothetical protein